MEFILNSVKANIIEQVKIQLPQILPKEVSDFATPVIKSTITESLEDIVLAKESSQPQSAYEAATLLTEFKLKKILLDKMQKSQSYLEAPTHKELYDGLVKSYALDKDLFASYGKAYSLKRDREDKDEDEDPSVGLDRGSSKGTKSHPKSSGKSAQAQESVFKFADTELLQNQGSNLELEYDFEECYKALSKKLDWSNPKGEEYPFDLSKPLTLIMESGHQIVSADYFFNNDLNNKRKVIKWYGHGHMAEIEVRRADNKLYKFMEECSLEASSSKRESKIFNWESKVTKRSSTSPSQRQPDMTLEIESHSLHTQILKDSSMSIKIALNLRMDYLPKKRWSNLKKKRSRIKIKDIEKQLKERRIMRSFEKFICGERIWE
ncbi:hypothetical protein Tco_0480287 [Tanacetum coccineum]